MAQRSVAPDLPGFTHISYIGGGGFADVFRYKDTLGRNVAVKVTQGVSGESAQAVAAEANLMAKLSSHPSIVSIYQAGVAPDGRTYLVMEECGKEHLGNLVANRGLTVSRVMEITIQVAGAVETAHRLGILHRDIKPANILFTGYQIPALTDFGISASSETGRAQNALSPAWAPPEQRPNPEYPMGPWSDVFSLGATMWAMLAKRSPLEIPGGPNDTLSLHHRARTFTPASTGRADVPEVLERVIATALARDPQQRYQSALEFARAIQGVQAQLNEAVTSINVLSDEPDYDELPPELQETGTKVEVFSVIDPYQDGTVGGTQQVTGPSGGVTSPNERYESERNALPQLGLHGRGIGAVGARDFTGPAVPVPADHTVLDAPVTAAPGPEPRRRGRTGAVVAALVAVVVLGGIGAAWASGMLGGGATVLEPEPTGEAPRDPVVARVAPVEDLEGEIIDDEGRFTWTNPDPHDGDSFLIDEVNRDEKAPVRSVSKPETTVELVPGRTCIDVSVRRGNGAVSDPVRKCVDS